MKELIEQLINVLESKYGTGDVVVFTLKNLHSSAYAGTKMKEHDGKKCTIVKYLHTDYDFNVSFYDIEFDDGYTLSNAGDYMLKPYVNPSLRDI